MKKLGKVIRTRDARTISVEILSKRNDEKRIKSKIYHVHVNEGQIVSINDMVTIQPCRPMSKTKKYILVGKSV